MVWLRPVSDKEYCHDRLGAGFSGALSDYDTQRRVEVLIGDFLADEDLNGKEVLDVGCGSGHFSHALKMRGAHVTACDIGPNLVAHVAATVGCNAVVADAMSLSAKFGCGRFDLVVSSECIEHTPDPIKCLSEFSKVLKPNGLLVVSTPNLLWQPVVRLASRIRARRFDGLENFISWSAFRDALEGNGVGILRESGLHLFPFQIPFHGVSRWCDRNLQRLSFVMINMCIMGRKQAG